MPVRELESQSLRLNIVVLLDLSDRIADETQRDRDQAIIRAITSCFTYPTKRLVMARIIAWSLSR